MMDSGLQIDGNTTRKELGGLLSVTVIIPTGSSDPRSCQAGPGSTGYGSSDKALGLGSRKSASAKGNARDTRRQQQVHAVFWTRSGRRRLDDGEWVDVFVRPGETVMVHVRRAVHLIACCGVRKAAREADGINISTDGKTFLRMHGVGANAVFDRWAPDPSEQDAFGDFAMKRHQLRIRPPMLQQASHATGVTSRKSGGTHAK